MKSKLYIFGCSYSALFGNSGITDEYYKYNNNKWPLHWSEILAEKLDMELINSASGGLGNDAIFDEFCKKALEIKSNDLVIIGWSYMGRFRVADKIFKYKWENLSAGVTKSHNLSPKTINEISINRATHGIFEEELHRRENLLKSYSSMKGFNLFFWNAGFPFKHQHGYLLEDLVKITPQDTFINHVHRRGGLNIENETNGKVIDNHLGESGNKIQAELFYEELKRKLIK